MKATWEAKMTTLTRLDSRTVRAKLKPRGRPYWSKAGDGLDLGYRRIKTGIGSWVLRRYAGDERYVLQTFSTADDVDEADGVRILTYHQATARARELAKAHVERERLEADGPPLTIASAVDEYVETRETRWQKYGGQKRDARARLAKHVDKALLDTPLALLTVDQLATWRKSAGERTAHDLKAALNAAARRFRDALPPILRDVIKDGLASPRSAPKAARDVTALSDADVRRIVAAAQEIDREGDWNGLFQIVLTLASTGSRFSQIARCVVSDVQPREKRLMIPVSRKGSGVKQASRTAVPIGPDVIAALQPATAGRLGNDPLFMRPDSRPIGVGKRERGEPRPWRSSGEFNRPWRLIAERAGLPGVTPYDLRHAAIIRALRLGLPVQLVARLFDTSAIMVQKNYSASIVDALGELSERMVVPLAPVSPSPIAAVR
jgi:integrase